MYSEFDIISFIAEKHGIKESRIDSHTDIFFDLHCVGDDFHELMQEYAKQFQVDMKKFKWYFHANEEGQSFGAIFFKAPYERVDRIPVAPVMLLDFANNGKWSIEYPKHKLPKYRIDTLINYLLIIIIIFFIIKSCVSK
jgi:hypothetical protein